MHRSIAKFKNRIEPELWLLYERANPRTSKRTGESESTSKSTTEEIMIYCVDYSAQVGRITLEEGEALDLSGLDVLIQKLILDPAGLWAVEFRSGVTLLCR
jgi:hypothetical protein